MDKYKNAKIKVIICDLGNVLMYFDWTNTYLNLEKICGIPIDKLKEKIKKTDIIKQYEFGLIDDNIFLQNLIKILDIANNSLNLNKITDLWNDIFWPNKEMINLITELKSKGLLVILLSNTNNLHFQYIKKKFPEIMETFDESILSYEKKCAKPDSAIFMEAINSAKKRIIDLDISQIIYIDDIKQYTDKAISLGIESFVYKSFPELNAWLKKKLRD
ncbi:hypothetical protein HZA55_00660 [Candidatus Poribacteria bacterium]|nr:hypothetical protein [Candidatus Poribacteria bacterium]